MVICVDAGSSEEEEKVEKDEEEEENAVARAKDLDARQQEVEQQEKLAYVDSPIIRKRQQKKSW